ncbi:uncharacterized protein PpBr36_10505 [Pyricularia pennisetigena]|uniref:uncharacterized protein n=1 Tax=Pyricularia pennisetigena TaxID=1578925 RepID=UPI00114E73D6|nr:uncharacterized protein PpBr36_10505 [Pyricularia pennisetigena]TLS21232.1 hypothetical protein PpBr36_10505 [Pyricularia pennisetigena]
MRFTTIIFASIYISAGVGKDVAIEPDFQGPKTGGVCCGDIDPGLTNFCQQNGLSPSCDATS